jgi:hypothetical protein
MFHVTCYGWLIFRADSMTQVARFTRALFTDFVTSASTISGLAAPWLQVVAPLFAIHIYQARKGSEAAPAAWPFAARCALYGAVGFLILLFGDFGGAQFIYFQF